MTDLEEKLYAAVKYALDRGQKDPDFGYVCGWGSQTFKLLCQAEASYLGKDVEEVERERNRDLQPEHRRREPDLVVLRQKVSELESRIVELSER